MSDKVGASSGEIEWINEGKSIILNGWYIHFKDMCAFAPRNPNNPLGIRRVELINKYVDADHIAYYKREDGFGLSEVSKRRMSISLFLTDVRAENLLQEAWKTYLVEKALKDG